MEALTVRRRGAAAESPRAWADAGLELDGESEWIVYGPEAALVAIDAALGRFAEAISAGVRVLRFGNAVGLFPVPGLGALRVRSGKWDEAAFEAMLADARQSSALPFSWGDAGKLESGQAPVADAVVPYHALVYLRHVLSPYVPRDVALSPALEAVLASPYRRLVRERRITPIDRVRNLDAASIAQVLRGASRWFVVDAATAAAIPLATELRGHLPWTMEEPIARASLDTDENRVVVAFLDHALAVVGAMRRAAEAGRVAPGFARRMRNDCDRLERELLPIRHARIWDDVGRLTRIPAASTVLQGRRGYKDVFRHYLRLREAASLVPVSSEAAAKLLESKDVALLYELWCFFAVIGAVDATLGPPARASVAALGTFDIAVPRSASVAWRGGVRVVYNRSFTRSKGDSYSLVLRPDVVLELERGGETVRHVFDAKFKLTQVERPEGEAEVEDAEVLPRGFKNADLHKMHAYRDAIRGTASAWVLYPGDEFAAFAPGGAKLNVPEEVSATFSGVGAVPAGPGSTGALHAVVEQLLR